MEKENNTLNAVIAKRVIIFGIALSTGFYGRAQIEFTLHDNGLMYHDTTVVQLKKIVDSLQLQFRSCELNSTYFSIEQARGYYFSADTLKNEIILAIKAGATPENLTEQFPSLKKRGETLILRRSYADYYTGKKVIGISEGPFRNYYPEFEFSDSLAPFIGRLKSEWIIKESSTASKHFSAFYLTTDFQKDTLPQKYARLIQYSDCMVDTSSQVIIAQFSHRRRTDSNDTISEESPLGKFYAYLEDKINPHLKEKDKKDPFYLHREKATEIIRKKIALETEFKPLLDSAAQYCIKNNIEDVLVESLVGEFISLKTKLEMMRRRRVYGMCSMDNSPRIHARQIAILSASSLSWEVFLRAHLDIMNDHFARASDGSYAWGKRQTYIRELEELNINVLDLLIGISLRISNPSQNHYYGTIGRIGRALAETQNPELTEQTMAAFIEDASLDDFNRLIMVNLYLTYANFQENEDRKKEILSTVKKSIEKLPEYMQQQITLEN